jgi:single-strand DNA-binding protein
MQHIMRPSRLLFVLLYALLSATFSNGWIPVFSPRYAARRPVFSFYDAGATPNRPEETPNGESLPKFGENEDDRLSDQALEEVLGDWDDRVARFNTLHLIGRVGNNPEPRYFDDGNVVVNLSLACERNYHYLERQGKSIKSGDEETDWYGLEIWGKNAEFVSKFVDKGARIGVIGALQIDEWNDKETGEKQTRAKCIVRELDILETRAEAESRRSNQRGASFYTSDDDADLYDPSSGSQGGFYNS